MFASLSSPEVTTLGLNSPRVFSPYLQAFPVSMDVFTLAMTIAAGLQLLKSRDQRRRIVLLARVLGSFQIEKNMQTLTEGYMRALDEKDPERREQVWSLLAATEVHLMQQVNAFSLAFAQLDARDTRLSKLAVSIPFADRVFSRATFDLRKALVIHAHGIGLAVTNSAQGSPRDKAFTMSAEFLLLQHTCHWFCRSRRVASARILVRHQTPYAQVLASVSPETRAAYRHLTGI